MSSSYGKLIFFTGWLLVVLMGLGLLGLLSGIAPIAASAGHWTVTREVLELGKHRAVDTHSLTITPPPDLGRPDLVFKGAGHYETGCRPCHGQPGVGPGAVARAMLPSPPDLAERVPRWDPEELFYIVRHGIKLTGMPAWPTAGREDEVWAVTAFLLAAPELQQAEYEQLVFGHRHAGSAQSTIQALEPEAATAAQSCARCHGQRGAGRMPGAVPRLGGQRAPYVLAALDAYAAGTRHSGMMAPIAESLAAHERREIAAYFAAQPAARAPAQAAPSAGDTERGAAIANDGLTSSGVPPCRDCHGPIAEPRNPMYPVLAGQYSEYLLLQLELFREKRRGGSSYSHLMQHIAARLGPEQMRDVVAYYAALSQARAAGDQ